MYKKKKLIETLNDILNLIPNDISPNGAEKKDQIKKDLKKLEDKTQVSSQQKEDKIVKG